MISRSVTVKIPHELERNAAMLVQTASDFESRIHVTYLNRTVNAKSIMGVMTLPLSDGDDVTLHVDGNDEEKAMKAMCSFLNG